MNSIGERLRQERLRRGFDLQKIADLTRINLAYLEAIEADDLEKIPGIFFTRSFVRQYARALDLDESEFEAELDRLAGCEEVPTLENDAAARGNIELPPVAALKPLGPLHALSALAAFLLILAACSAIFVLWQRSREQRTAVSEPRVSASAPQSPQPQPEPFEVAAGQPAPVRLPADTPQAPPAAPVAQTPAAQSGQIPAASAPQVPHAAAEPAQVSGEDPASAPVRVEIRATQPVWVRVAADGKYLFSAVLAPNQKRIIGGNQSVEVKAGNAAGVEMLWNGKPVGALGAEGQVKNLEFRPDGFRTVVPPPAKPPEPPDDGI